MAGSRLNDCVNAAVDALVADSTLSTLLGGAKVYTYVPEDTVPPYCYVWGGYERSWAEALGGGAAAGREVDIEVTAVSAYRGTKQMDEIIDQALETLLADTPYSAVSGYAGVLFVACERPQAEHIEGRIFFSRRAVVRVYTSTA